VHEQRGGPGRHGDDDRQDGHVPIEPGVATAVRPSDAPDVLRSFFEAVMDAVYPYVYRRCGHDRATAEDLCQDTFVTAVRTLREGKVEALTVGWMVSVARTRFIDHCRRESRRERHLHAIEGGQSTSFDAVGDDVVESAIVTELLAELPASQRLNVVLHHLDGMPVPEVAAATGNSVRAVESSLARARRTLRGLAERGER
jgi:RNA polymerase sigma-70 factor (ECF subfamily)